MHNTDCIFCKIIHGEIPSIVVYETDSVLAFRDINPQAPSHILIIPKMHYETLLDVPANEGIFESLFSAATAVAKLEGLDEKGFRTVFNCKEWGGQVVYHLHLHLLGGKPFTADLVF